MSPRILYPACSSNARFSVVALALLFLFHGATEPARLKAGGAGAQYPQTIDRFIEQQKLLASDAVANDRFGRSVVISGDTAVISSFHYVNNQVGESKAYVFIKSAGVWREQQRLQPSDAEGRYNFGRSIAISGDTMIISSASSVYVFVRSGGMWREQQRLDATIFPGDNNQNDFGSSIALSSDTAIIGAFGDDNSGGTNAGAAYIFDRVSFVPPGRVLISEFRLSGPGLTGAGAASDEFIELYNNTDSGITVRGEDGSSGWALRSSDGSLSVTIPNGTHIPARSHYLVANTGGYSLAAYPTNMHGCPDGNCASGDLAFASDTPENTGIALFSTTDTVSFDFDKRLDAVGPNTESNALYREGVGYAPVTGGKIKVQHSFVRRSGGGRPTDSGDNARDFQLVATDGADTLPAAVLGAPGPENSASPVRHNAALKASVVVPFYSSYTFPNRVRDGAPDPVEPHNSPRGTLKIRRRFTNTSGRAVTRLRFRVLDIATAPRPDAATADLRVLGSPGRIVTIEGKDVKFTALTREDAAFANVGGGINTTLSVALSQPLGHRESINVEFNLGVIEDGNLRFVVNVEALPGLAANRPGAMKGGARGKAAKLKAGRATR